MRIFSCFVVCLALLVLTSPDARADKRVALVIGNGAYRNVPQLANPKNDAADVAAALKQSGFDVALQTDLDQAAMQEAAIRFAREARGADVALFYYSGHALQFGGVNYLVPVDAVVHDEVDLRRMARADEILADLQQARNLRILVLDACRDNPFADALRRNGGQGRGVAVGRGLAKMDSPEGTIISYATQAGRTADDGDSRNSPYTASFLKHIQDKDNVSTVFQTISAGVYEQTKGTQVPELSLSFFGEFYLNGKQEKPALQATAVPSADPCAAAAEHWRAAEAVGTIDAYKDHVQRFPDCSFAGLAKSRIETLSKAADATRFDGTWLIKEICDAKPPVWPAGILQYSLRIKDGQLHNTFGMEGKPGSATFDGKVEANGSLNIAVKGLTQPASDPIHRPAGTPFGYKMALELKYDSGAGARFDSPRPCHYELKKLTASLVGDGDTRPQGNEKGGATAAVDPGGRTTSRSAPQGEGGLSCSVMRGRCAAVCVANTGRPDCASTVCVRLQEMCMDTGCWRGRGFSGCGLARR
jgi:uncharacterized caspase-like protein